MHTLFETETLRIQHEYEQTQLVRKSSGVVLLEDDFYGDPDCAIISNNDDWAIMAGEHLTIWKETRRGKYESTTIENEELRWIHSLRIKTDNIVEILINPWSEKSAIWELNIDTLQVVKIRDFMDYFEKGYTEDIKW